MRDLLKSAVIESSPRVWEATFLRPVFAPTTETSVLESIQAISLLTIMEIVGPVLLLAVLIYGTMQWSRRRRGPTQAVREASTRQLYREGAEAEKREEAGSPPAEHSKSRP
jgi:hypothetical protein